MEKSEMRRERWFASLVGLGAVGDAVVGVLSFLLALVSALGGNLVAAGVCLVAAAVAFGLLLVGLVPR